MNIYMATLIPCIGLQCTLKHCQAFKTVCTLTLSSISKCKNIPDFAASLVYMQSCVVGC